MKQSAETKQKVEINDLALGAVVLDAAKLSDIRLLLGS